MVYPHFLRALSSQNYRRFFVGQGVSLVGNWMTTTAASWLAYELSHSAFIVGLVPFASQIPLLVLAPFGGVLGDRRDRRTLLIVLSWISVVYSSLLTLATATGHATVSLLVALAGLRGLVNAVEFPTRQSFIVELIQQKDHLPNAIALNSTLFNLARVVGPAFAGVMIVTIGPALCFALDALSFIAVIISLHTIGLPARQPAGERPHPWDELLDGLRYVRNHPGLRSPLLLVAQISLVGFAASILAPVFARDVFHRDAQALGYMFSAVGAGALVSAGLLTNRTSPEGLPSWIGRGAWLLGLSQLGFALSPSLPLALGFLCINGMGIVLVMAGSNTLIQARVEDRLRGRVMGLFVMAQGMYPVGSLLIGAFASAFTPVWAVSACALATSAAAFIFLRTITCREKTA